MKWISIEDSLPEEGQMTWITVYELGYGFSVQRGRFLDKAWEVHDDDGCYSSYTPATNDVDENMVVTYWAAKDEFWPEPHDVQSSSRHYNQEIYLLKEQIRKLEEKE